MPVNSPQFFAVFGLRRNHSIIKGKSIIKGGGNASARTHFADKNDCIATCLVDCRFTSQYEALKAVARKKFAVMLELMKKQCN